jgi:hypothetical protein
MVRLALGSMYIYRCNFSLLLLLVYGIVVSDGSFKFFALLISSECLAKY